MSVESADQGEIVLAAVDEDALLDVSVALLGIFVLLFQTTLRHVVETDVLLQLPGVALQHGADVLGQHQTGVALLVAVLRHDDVGHTFQTPDQTVVTGDVLLRLVQELGEGQLLLVEVPVLLRGLMTGVGQVEYVVLLLRVEHHRILVGALHRLQQLGEQALRALPPGGTAHRELAVVLLQLCLQDGERLFQVLLLQHGIGLDDEACQHNEYDNQLFHSSFCLLILLQRYKKFSKYVQVFAIILAR